MSSPVVNLARSLISRQHISPTGVASCRSQPRGARSSQRPAIRSKPGALAGHGPDRAGRDGVDPDLIVPEVAREVSGHGLEPSLRNTHPIVDRPGEATVEIEAHHAGALGRLHRLQQAHRQRLERKGRCLEARRHALPGRVQEVAAERVIRHEADRVDEPIQAFPIAYHLGASRLTCSWLLTSSSSASACWQPLWRRARSGGPRPTLGQQDLGARLLRSARHARTRCCRR